MADAPQLPSREDMQRVALSKTWPTIKAFCEVMERRYYNVMRYHLTPLGELPRLAGTCDAYRTLINAVNDALQDPREPDMTPEQLEVKRKENARRARIKRGNFAGR